MRCLVLGGAGRVGSVTVHTLLAYPDTEKVIVTDVSEERIETLP